MALSKEIETQTGAISNYQKIKTNVLNGKNLEIRMEYFATEEARQANKVPMESHSFLFTLTDEQQNQIFEMLYGFVKSKEEFQGAVDC